LTVTLIVCFIPSNNNGWMKMGQGKRSTCHAVIEYSIKDNGSRILITAICKMSNLSGIQGLGHPGTRLSWISLAASI